MHIFITIYIAYRFNVNNYNAHGHSLCGVEVIVYKRNVFD